LGNVLTIKSKKSGCYLQDERLIGTSKYQKHASFLKCSKTLSHIIPTVSIGIRAMETT